ncbi:MAG TPA: cobalt transporter CbiM [Terriglobales bacterium]|jgi:cobalt/nickel transport system permease protein|nr:cobalt transporter CbiM [Terriglobales bacterium]
MHIPDGYLSPSTCGVLYAGAAGGWYTALRRLKRTLLSRVIPLVSVFAAFSFVVMMFNLPLPGGTTGHALGVTTAAIVLGPSGAILALSIAIAIQALFFGDGGISTLGANCFNMAIVASLTAYASYRLIAAGAALSSRRRVVAAAIAGYFAVNASALLAAVEFGIQPVLFHDASGTPLYAPYRLSVAVPAMMIGHLTFAGLAEAVISAGLVAYLQVADPGLLRATSGIADAITPATAPRPATSLRRLWTVIAIFMLLTPLGILAAGTAWGEWSPAQLVSAASRPDRATSPVAVVPAGLQRLSNLWTAPFPAYAPAFIRARGFGYLLSAMFGVGLLLLISLALRRILQRKQGESSA